jgi:hypothetical protein
VQLVQRAHVGLPVDFVQEEAVHASADGVRHSKLTQHLLTGGDESLNMALSKGLMLELARAAASPPARLSLHQLRAIRMED